MLALGRGLCGSKASCRLHRFGRSAVGSQGLNVNLSLKTVVTLVALGQ